MRSILSALALSLLWMGVAHAQTRELTTQGQLLDRIAAIVNDGVVLNSELDDEVAMVSERLRGQKLELPPQNVLRQQVLERLVVQEIQLQRAQHDGVKVTDEVKRRKALEAIRASKADEETEIWVRRLRDEAYVEVKS